LEQPFEEVPPRKVTRLRRHRLNAHNRDAFSILFQIRAQLIGEDLLGPDPQRGFSYSGWPHDKNYGVGFRIPNGSGQLLFSLNQ